MKKKINFSELNKLIEDLSKNSPQEEEIEYNKDTDKTKDNQANPPNPPSKGTNPFTLFLILVLLLASRGTLSKKKKK